MPVNNASDIGQSDTRPLELIRSVEPLKDAEQLVRVAHIKSYPIVAYE